jgi:putative photosynthetic complex assembly protein 2
VKSVHAAVPGGGAIARDPAPHGAPRERVVLPAVLLIVGFWWLATGAIVALQRDAVTRTAALIVLTALAAFGAYLIHSRRERTTPAAARESLLGGALLWAWVSASFYAGWIVGPGLQGPTTADGPSFRAALEALHSTWYNEVASVGCLVLAWVLTRGASNRMGLHVLVVFWGMHQLARVNLFLGVVNPATRFLPEPLLWLAEFFGPARNSPLLALSVIWLSFLAALLFRRARVAPDPFRRHAAALLGVLVALGALEHLLLGTSWDAPLWDAFLRARG